MKCKNCKADNKSESICDAGIACYVLRCGEYGCALNGKTVDKLLRMKKAVTNADRLRAMTDEELAEFLIQDGDCPPEKMYPDSCPNCYRVTLKVCYDCWLDWLKQEAHDEP